MLVFEKVDELQSYLQNCKQQLIGFVPTMGALHEGHLSLIQASKSKTDITVCSIFVNPIQFNKKEDLDNYPRNKETDLQLLKNSHCDVVFIPSVEEMYPTQHFKEYDFGKIGEVMEGEHRPGHFNGVGNVIERFFEIIQPDFAFFGEKDFQQLAIVKELARQLKSKTQIIGCPIYREKNGLAMSSRNERLSIEERLNAKIIYDSLLNIKHEFKSYSVEEVKNHFKITVNQQHPFIVEYIEIADGNTLQSINNWNESDYCVAFTAVNVGNVRLIDNMTIFN
ncbi:MAG: pantoate--beta-alanine ligase [Flavobacteriales bacterium]|nr:pantoate--beta-alanine ligase [Flavobacteriales bacterium]MCB9336217.1 pantoate--beta-alanine ligase [Flavobacteriales bacterium]